ncbi:unnamed protein product [Ambrosiozyma monospora]|uniref:Unnamed protein product n=1 Tax=Ambrosiozyma monospora TaxID=43982 RepID=A0ACB5TR61_AMBMO|nr:unnamed protein product [Ambrosiozyma monospora]
MAGYDQLDAKSVTSGISNGTYLSRIIMSSNSNSLVDNNNEDDGLDPELPLLEEKRRLFWDIYSADKWMSAVADLPPMITMASNYQILTKLPSTSSLLEIDHELLTLDMPPTFKVNDGLFLEVALKRIEGNCVLLDMKSASSRVIVLTVAEGVMNWSRTYLDVADLNADGVLYKIDNDVRKIVAKLEGLIGNLFFLELDKEPTMKIVVSSCIAGLYHRLLEKFSGFFKQKLEQQIQIVYQTEYTNIECDPSLFAIPDVSDDYIQFFKKILFKSCESCMNQMDWFATNKTGKSLLVDPPMDFLFKQCVKSLLHTSACFRRFKNVLHLTPEVSDEMQRSLDQHIDTVCDVVFNPKNEVNLINPLSTVRDEDQLPIDDANNRNIPYSSDWKREKVIRFQLSLKNWMNTLADKPEEISFFNML